MRKVTIFGLLVQALLNGLKIRRMANNGYSLFFALKICISEKNIVLLRKNRRIYNVK